jgi:hypothetical protein
VGQMTIANANVSARSVLLGSSAGGQGSLLIQPGGILHLTPLYPTDPVRLVANDIVLDGGFIDGSNATLLVGNNTNATMTISNGVAVLQDAYVGYETNKAGFVTTANGSVTVLSNLFVGASLGATGTVVMSGGTNIVSGTIIIGTAGGKGRVILSTNAGPFFVPGKGGGPGPLAGGGGGVLRLRTAIVSAGPGSQGTLTISDGTVDVYSNMVVGDCGVFVAGYVEVTGGNLFVTNATADAFLEVRDGAVTLSSGQLKVDKLVMTNSCGLFVHSGGTLIVGSMVLDPNLSAVGDGIPNGWKQQYGLDLFDPNLGSEDPDGDGCNNLCEFLTGGNPVADIKAITKEGNNIRVTWQAAAAKTNALQFASGSSYTTNFTDLFVVTNTVGSVTNYVDVGGATNVPSRYYRIRLVP